MFLLETENGDLYPFYKSPSEVDYENITDLNSVESRALDNTINLLCFLINKK